MSDDKKTDSKPEQEDKPEKKEKKESQKKDKKEAKEPKEKKAPVKRKKPEPTAPTRVSERAKKDVERFAPEKVETKAKELEVGKGKGTPLGDIENIELGLKATKSTEAHLAKLFSFCFPSYGRAKKDIVKKSLRKFNGLPNAEAREAAQKKMEASELKVLKPIAHLLDVEVSGTKAQVIERIAEMLNKPKSSGKPYKGKGKKAASSKGGKRTPTSYILYCQDHREEFKKKNPDAKMTDLTKIMAAAWNELSEKEQGKYKAKAQKLKDEAADDEPVKKKARASKKSKKAKDEEEEEDEEEQDSEEEESD